MTVYNGGLNIMKILETKFVQGFIKMANDGYLQGWHERNGGNLSYRLKAEEVEMIRPRLNAPGEWTPIGTEVPGLAGEFFLVTGSGKYFRNIIVDPEVCLAIIVGGVISTVHDDLVARGLSLFLWTFAVVFCHNTLGYLLGWLAGKCAGFNTAKKRTISIEVGMQNAGLATVLAGNFFAAQPLAVLPCAISCAWHSLSGTILAGIYLKWDRMHEKK